MTEDVVLVVDDDADTRQLLKLMIEDTFAVRTLLAQDGAEALEHLSVMTPSLVLLDIRMSRMDGISLARQLKSSSATRDIPLIALTGWSKACDDALQAGCCDFVEKPFEIDDLLNKVRKHLVGEHATTT